MLGVQKRNTMVVMNPNTPVTTALEKIPRAATTLFHRTIYYLGGSVEELGLTSRFWFLRQYVRTHQSQ